jgi:hypothetical protein
MTEQIEKLKRLKVGETELISANREQAAALRTAAYRLDKGYFSFRQSRKQRDVYAVTLQEQKPIPFRAYIRAELDKRLANYEVDMPLHKVQQHISKYNAEHGTAYQTSDAGIGKTIITRNTGAELCRPLIAALNGTNAGEIEQQWRALSYSVRVRLLQMGMGVSEPLAPPAQPAAESAADK